MLSGHAFNRFARAVEAELMRHGYPSFAAGHARGIWDVMPNAVVLAAEGSTPQDVARDWMSDQTPLWARRP